MAITLGDVILWDKLRELDLIPPQPAVLEIGRANWYGDVGADKFHEQRAKWSRDHCPAPATLDTWTVADWYYSFMLRGPTRVPIDLDPNCPEPVHRLDLNNRLNWKDGTLSECMSSFDLVINTGTCEHVFDQRRVWETIHDACKPGGLMVHALPLWGWLDHGFYNYHPTFVADLAAENGYKIAAWLFCEFQGDYHAWANEPRDFELFRALRGSRKSAMMHVAFVKEKGDPFRVPMQGVYSGRATTSQLESWRENR